MKKELFVIGMTLLSCILFFRCSGDEISPQPEVTWQSAAANLEAEPLASPSAYRNGASGYLAGLKGQFDPILGRCVPPILNCAGENTQYPEVFAALYAAVDNQELDLYWTTSLGQQYLKLIDPRIKEDLLSGIIILKQFESEYLFVFADATEPWQGYDYSVPGPNRVPIQP